MTSMVGIMGIKLISGLELIGKCGFNGDTIFIDDALLLTISHTPNGLNVGFAPIALLACDNKPSRNIEIDKVQVLCPFPVSEECQKAYLSQISGIAVVSSVNNVNPFIRN